MASPIQISVKQLSRLVGLPSALLLLDVRTNDNEQLEAGMLLYDSFYRWARDAFQEEHHHSSSTASTQTASLK